MANEITMSASIAYEDSEGSEYDLAVAELIASVATKKVTKLKQNVGTNEEAINLGDLSSAGYAMFINRDETNIIELRVATGGAKFATLKADGGFAFLYLGAGAQVPYAIATTASCQMDVLITSQ